MLTLNLDTHQQIVRNLDGTYIDMHFIWLCVDVVKKPSWRCKYSSETGRRLYTNNKFYYFQIRLCVLTVK
jgi:hypothetical protein